MKKLFKYLLLVPLITVNLAFAFLTGSAPGSTPWVTPVPGAVFVSFNAGAPINATFQAINNPPSINVTTLKILEVFISSNYVARGGMVTVSYVLQNTSTSNAVNNITSTLNFYSLTTGNVQNGYFSVTRVSPAGPFTLNGGATINNVFRVTIQPNRPTGNFIVDGLVSGGNPPDDHFWSSALIDGGFVFTGAITPNFLRETTSNLTVSTINIVSPNGAIDQLVSNGQNFVISFNIQNLGESDVIGTRVVEIDWQGTVLTYNYNVGQTFNVTLTANALGTSLVTVAINTIPGNPIDNLTGAQVGFLNPVATLSVTVENPAQLDILGTTIVTINPTQFTAFQFGPVTVSVQVRNIGSANAIITVAPADLQFLTSGLDQSGSYQLFVPSTSVWITSNQTLTVNYVINRFGGGIGICTVNATLSAIDQNSGWVTTNTAAINEVATYNVTYNAGIVIGAITTDIDPVGYLGTFHVYVPISGIKPGAQITVGPALNDLIISINGIDVSALSLNVSAVIPASFLLNGLETKTVTYTVTFLASAVSGEYTVDVKPGRPSATNNVTLVNESSAIGSLTPKTDLTYDPISPNLILATANINNIPLRLTAPTDNFYLTLEFSETMNVNNLPLISFTMTGPVPSVTTGNWNGPLNTIFTSNTMNLTAANRGFVTVNLLGGPGSARDLALNTVAPSPSFIVFYVDALKPTGSVTINNGEAITSNPLITLDFTLVDDFSATANMEMYILGLPTSNVSSNPGIAVNTWIPYNQEITLNLDTMSFNTKNIAVMFRDQAGNVSNVVSDNIFLDTDSIIWIQPTSNAMVSNNISLNTATSVFADSISYYVSINNILTLISANVDVNNITGTCNYLWTAANIFPGTTTNAELVAVVSKNNTLVTATITNIIIDNTNPTVTINYPPTLTYVNGLIIISGNASDNGLATSISLVELSFNGGATYTVAATGTDNWTYNWTVPPADPDPTTYNIVARSWDSVGNPGLSNLVTVTKTNLQPSINLNIPPSPSLNRYLKNMFHFEGTVTSKLALAEVRISFGALTTNILAVGTANWAVTFSIPEATLIANTGSPGPIIPLQVVAITIITPNPIASSATFNYRVDGITPNLSAINIVNGMGAIGTLNITGIFGDVGSGVSAIEVSVDAGTWTTISYTTNFTYPLGIINNTYNISFRAFDNTYLTANISDIFTYTITRNDALLPTGVFITPPSGSYVNNTMNMSGTINVNDGGILTGVWVRYISNTSDSDWVTANFVGTTWTYNWKVPVADAHNTTYNAGLRVLSSTGMLAEVSPFAQAFYIKDIYGPASVIVNLINGMYLPAAQSPAPVLIHTFTDGALVSATYLIVDGITYNSGVLNPPPIGQNTSWLVNWDFITQRGSAHVIFIRAVDQINNWTNSRTLNIRTVPTRLVTEPLPSGNVIDGSTTMTNPVYATSLNVVSFNNIVPANVVAVYVDSSGLKMPIINGAEIGVTLAATLAAAEERPYVITIIESDGVNVTAHYQPVVFDRTPPTVNVIFNGVARYYPDGYIAPNERFMINVLDRTASGDYGAGFSFTPHFSFVTDNPTERVNGAIQRSVFYSTTTVDTTISNSTFDPYAEILRFDVNLNEGTYDLSIDAIDNAGNVMVATFNVRGLIVVAGATGLSGGIDKNRFITSYPNPYDPADGNVQFTYYLKDNARKTRIFIYNEIGQLLNVISILGPDAEGTHAGYNAVQWDAQDKFGKVISNGVYLFMIVVEGEKNQTMAKGKMAVLRR